LNGSPEPPFGNYFVSTYPPFSCWKEAALDDFRDQLERVPAAPPPLGLYAHVPFCVDRCQYCYYLSHDHELSAMGAYLEALLKELGQYARAPALAGRRLDFVYFGGGTPSLFGPALLERLLEGVQALFPFDAAREVTFECAPRTVTSNKLRLLRDAGVTRLSLGAQQLNDEVLRMNGRVHLSADVERAYAWAREVGFDTINLDLIAGLVGETEQSFASSLERVLELLPDSVTIYQLEIPLNTPLYRSIQDGSVPAAPPDWETKRARVRGAFARLEASGYTVRSSCAAVRDPDRHPFLYQDVQYLGADLLGVGCSAFSSLDGFNQQNLASLPAYFDAVQRGELPLWRGYRLNDDERMVREFILQLKLGSADRGHFRERYGLDPAERFKDALEACARAGWLRVADEAIEVTREGLLRIDRLLPGFYLEPHRNVRYS